MNFHSPVEKASLFYSIIDGILFFVAGYDNANGKTDQIIDNKITCFARLALVKRSEVKTMIIEESSNYTNMRIYFAKTKNIPEEAYQLTCKKWTMPEFLKN